MFMQEQKQFLVGGLHGSVIRWETQTELIIQEANGPWAKIFNMQTTIIFDFCWRV